MIDQNELQGHLDWVYSRVAKKDRPNLSHKLVWQNFPTGSADYPYPAHWDVVFSYGGKTTQVHVDLLLRSNDRGAYLLLFDLRNSLGITVDVARRRELAPPTPAVNPIGDKWPRRGEHAYRAVGTGKWKTGDVWEDSTGIFIGEWRRGAWGIRYYVWVKQDITG